MSKKEIFEEGIGEWTKLKLDYIWKYLGAYSNILHYGGFPEYYYVDLFCGGGFCTCKDTGKKIRGSSVLSLCVKPIFSKYFFNDIEEDKIKKLEGIVNKDYSDREVQYYCGDSNVIINKIIGDINDNVPFIALLDPQKGDLYWETIKMIATKPKAEVLINFPLGMALNREMHLDSQGDKINKIFGTPDWKPIYLERKAGVINATEARMKFLKLYLNNLISVGFKYYAVKDIRNSKNSNIYYLIFGTKKRLGLEKMKDEFVKDEKIRDSLFFLNELKEKIYKVFNGQKSISLNIILERLLPGVHVYRKQDYKNALKLLLKDGKIERVKPRGKASSFLDDELINFK